MLCISHTHEWTGDSVVAVLAQYLLAVFCAAITCTMVYVVLRVMPASGGSHLTQNRPVAMDYVLPAVMGRSQASTGV